jgi:hypothetical protein
MFLQSSSKYAIMYNHHNQEGILQGMQANIHALLTSAWDGTSHRLWMLDNKWKSLAMFYNWLKEMEQNKFPNYKQGKGKKVKLTLHLSN